MKQDNVPHLPHIVCTQEFKACIEAHVMANGPVVGEDGILIIGLDQDVVEVIEFMRDIGCIGDKKNRTGQRMFDQKTEGRYAMWDSKSFDGKLSDLNW